MESNDGNEVPASNESAPMEKEFSCKFCNKKFIGYRALGGHQNRHRSEREAEKQNKILSEAEGSASHQPLIFSTVGGGPSNSFSQPHPKWNLGQESSNSLIPQNAAMHYLFPTVMLPQGSTGSSLQHHKSYQSWVFSSAATIGAPSSSASQPQSPQPSLSYKKNFGQESSNSSICRGRSPPDLNIKLLKPLCDERKFDQASNSSVTPQNAITEGLDLNVMPSCDDENSDQQVSSSSTPVNEEEEKLDLNLKL